MNIAFVVGKFPSLSETFIINQITGLLDQGHQVTIYAHQRGNEQKVHPDVKKYGLDKLCHYHAMPGNKLQRLLKAFRISLRKPKLLRTLNVFKYGGHVMNLQPFFLGHITGGKQYDIILCHFGTLGNTGAIVRDAGLIKGKLLTVFHGKDLSTYIQQRGERAYDYLFSNGDLFLPISEFWKNKMIELGCDERKIIVHRMGIEMDKFVFRPRQIHEGERIRITSIARLVEKKGLEYGIRAMGKVLESMPNVEYRIVGDGPLMDQMKELIEQLRLQDRVHLLGWKEQKEVVSILNDTHLFLAPSVTASDGDQEGIPVVLMEALSMGIPVISTFHTGIPELIHDGQSGYLVPEKDVDELARKIQELVMNDQRWSPMGYAGRDHVDQHFNVRRLNDRLVDIFTTLVKGNTDHEYSNYQRSLL